MHEGGTLSDSETWAAGSVHVVYGTITVPTNATLTIASGAVVKFVGGGIVANGTVIAKGVTFTDIDDDSFVGDMRQNGEMRTYASYVLTGKFETDDETLITCAKNNDALLVCGETTAVAFDTRGAELDGLSGITVHAGGVLSDSETWAAGSVHVVYGTITVPTNATLTIASGVVVKFVGGGIVANGTVIAKGVTFTDIDDDSFAGDTRQNGEMRTYASYVLTGKFETDDETLVTCAKNNDALLVCGEMKAAAFDTFEGVTGHAGGVMEQDETWAGTGTVHYVRSDLVICAGAHLTIEPGAIVRVAPNCLIMVENGASLSAVGTADNRIAFSSICTNNVADATTFWRGFLFATNAAVNAAHVCLSQCGTDHSPQLDLAYFDNLELDAGTVSLSIVNSGSARRTLTLRQGEGLTRFNGELGGLVDVVKTGSGKLSLDVEQISWTGSLTVAEGGVRNDTTGAQTLSPIAWRYLSGGGSTANWNCELGRYVLMGYTNTIRILYRYWEGNEIYLPENYLSRCQNRLDGWFYVSPEQAGAWDLRQGYDDYMYVAFDGVWLIKNPTYYNAATATWTARAGWHRFTIVCGDTGGDYGVIGTSSDHISFLDVSINGTAKVPFNECVKFAGENEAGLLVEDDEQGRATLVRGAFGMTFPAEVSRELYDNNFLTHRWSFNSNYVDSVGGQNAVPCGTVAPTFSADGKSVRLPGGKWGTCGIELGTNVLGKIEPVTIEIWATQHELRNWSGIINCGADLSNYFTPVWSARKDELKAPVHVGTSNYGDDVMFCGYPCNEKFHISIVLTRNDDLTTSVSLCKRDALTGRKLGSYAFTVDNWCLSDLNQATCLLGHSVCTGDDDANASYDEVRIWRAALSDAQLEINAVAGPDVVPDVRSTLPMLPPSRTITVADGAVLDLHGGLIVSSNVTGTVANGFVVAPVVSAAPVITTPSLLSAVVRRPYEVQLAASNGVPPYVWRILAGEKYVRTTVTNSFSTIADGPLVANTSGDDVCSDAYALPFAFPFFGKCYTNVWLSSNGTLSFDGAQTDRTPAATTFRSRPWIAGLWRDLNLANGGVYVTHVSEDRVSFRWKGTYYSGGKPVDFAISLCRSGKIVVSYGEGNASGGWVGVASGEGYVNYFYNSDSWSLRNDVVFMPDGLPAGLTYKESGEITGTPIGDGTNVMRVAVTDSVGEVSVADVTLVVSPHTNAQPVVTGYAPRARTVVALPEDETVFEVSAYDPLGDELSYVWLVDGETNCVTDTGWFVFRPAETFGGRHQVTCLVTDGFWTIPAEMTWETETPRWYVANTGDDANDGNSFATGFATLQKAVDSAVAGDIVYVAAGTYAPFATGNKALRIWAAKGAKPVVDGGGTNRCVTAGTSGQTMTSFRGIEFRNGYASENGGGALGGSFDRCVFAKCSAENGGGVSGATLTNCQLEDNAARALGGGAQGSTLTHCTVVRNRARLGGGVSGCTVRNSIVWGNHGVDGVITDNFNGDTFVSTCTYPMPSSGNNQSNDPLLVKTADGCYRLFDGSACVDAADASYAAGAIDLGGTNRVLGVAADMGATEGVVSGRLVRTIADGAGMVTPSGVVGDGDSMQLEARSLDANHAFLGFFTNGVKLAGAEEYDGFWRIAFAPVDSDAMVTAKFAVQTFHVATNGNDAADGLAWATARRTINAAIPLARSGDTILVSDGIYDPIAATDNLFVTIRSANGYASTIIDGGGMNRCALLGLNLSDTNTVLKGFMLRNGHAQNGAGAMYGTICGCYVKNNTATEYGGGLRYGTADSCVFWENAAGYGGGIANTTVYNCTIYGNHDSVAGGGAYCSSAYNTIIRRNTATTDAGYSSQNYYDVAVYSCCLNDWNDISGSYNCNPLFVYESEGDFRLRTNSPILDLGEDQYVRGSEDILGLPRISGDCVSIGAFEGATVGYVIATAISGYGDVLPRYALVQTGEAATFTAVVGDRPFLGFSTNGVDIIETEKSFTWPKVVSDGTLTLHFATNIYVNAATGDDANSGFSEKRAKRTLQAAIDLAKEGEVVLVGEGVYEPVVTGNKRITVVAQNGHEKTFIDGGGTNRCVHVIGKDWQTDRDVKFVGFTIRNGSVSDAGSGGAGCSGGTFDRCYFCGNDSSGNNCWGGAARYATLNNCLIAGNRSYGGAGAHYCTLVNCTVTDNVAFGSNGGGCDVCTVINSIVWNNTAPNSCSNYYGGTFTYTCSAPLHSGTGNLCRNPYFTDAAAGDYRLRQYSPCLDVGDNASAVGDFDFAGTNRIMGASVDLGAYEGWVYLPTPGAPTNVTASFDRHIGFVRLAWTADEFARSFRIERATDESFASVVELAVTADSFYDDVTAMPSSNYWYRIVAVNPTGASDPSESVRGRCLAEMTIGDLSLAAGQAGVSYSAKLSVSGGSGDYTWKSGADNYDAKRRMTTYLDGVADPVGLYSVDDAAVAYPLPFDFPFFGKTYNKLWISSNGTLTFDGAFSSCSPNLSIFASRVMIAPFWTDLRTGSSGVRVSVSEGESVTFFWSSCSYYSGGSAVNVSATLFADGTIVFSYGDGNANGAFVGISAGDGVRYTQYGWQNQSLKNADGLVFAPQKIPAGLTLGADGMISGKPKAPGSYTFSVLVTDSLGNAVTQSLTLDVAVNENLLVVQFDLGENGTRAGGGDLIQYVAVGESAEAPSVRVRSGLVLDSWSESYTNITSNTVVKANYRSAYVDLHVDSLTVPSTVAAGEELTVAWTVGNTGNPAFTGTMTERISLVSATNAADVRVVATVNFAGTVDRDGTVERSTTFAVPLKGWDGTWYVRVETAVNPSVREAGGDNARAAEQTLTITPVPLPDLVVEGVEASLSLAPGEAMAVSYREKNTGAGNAEPVWTDGVYLESLVDGATVRLGAVAHEEGLASEASASRATTFVLPEQIALAGAVRVKVVADADDAVVESDEGNVAYGADVLTLATNLYLSAASDSVQENLSSGVRFTVKRSGPTSEPMTVMLATDVAGQVTLPESVTIPAGNGSTIFYVKPIDNTVVDGSRIVGIAATSGDCRPAAFDLTILDNEVPKLTLALDKAAVREGDGKITATVTRELVTDQPLTVYLSGVSSSRCTYPSSVVIPAGAASVTFEIVATDDDVARIAEKVTLRASTSGYDSATVSYDVEDDDIPGVTLGLTPEEVSEGAGALAIYATLTRSDTKQIKKAITVKLTASQSNQLILKDSVTIPAYTMGVRFAIGVIDNDLDDGDRDVTINGAILVESCGCSGQPSNGDVITGTVRINDNDGPSLSLKAEPSTMREGRETAGYLVLSHNSTLTEDLVVQLSYDVEGEIEIPPTATIPAGARSVRIPVRTIDDGENDGGQLVSVYADDVAGAFASGSTWVQVSDQNLPDLRVTSVVPVSQSVVALSEFDVTFAVTNDGFYACRSTVPYAVHIVKGSSSASLSSATLVCSGTTTNELLRVGESESVTVRVRAPEMPGDYRIAVVVNPDDIIKELDSADNTTWSSTVGVSVAYTATVESEKKVYQQGETVALRGHAVLADGQTPAVSKKIEINVWVSGMYRQYSATTDANGDFSASFVPFSSESGHYTLSACYPGLRTSTVQGSFDILGMKYAGSSYLTWNLEVGHEATQKAAIRNLSGVALTGLEVAFSGAPDNCELSYELAEDLPGNGTVYLAVKAKALEASATHAYAYFNAMVTCAEGLSVTVPCAFYAYVPKVVTPEVVVPKPSLSVSPGSVDTTMTVGKEKYLTFKITNNGNGDSGAVTVTPPSIRWMSVVSGTIDNLGPGEEATVTLLLAPARSDGLSLGGTVRGSVAVNCAKGAGVSYSFALTPVSEEVGALNVAVADEYTYYIDSNPLVSNATVRVAEYYSNRTVWTGTTGASGRANAESLPEGTYRVTVSAAKHGSKTETVEIAAGRSTGMTVFLQTEICTATWEVREIEVEDTYEITLLLDYETQVPAPIIRATVSDTLPDLAEGERFAFTVTLENLGLIRAEDVRIQFPAIDGCVFSVPSLTYAINAKSSITVPVVVTCAYPPGKSGPTSGEVAGYGDDGDGEGETGGGGSSEGGEGGGTGGGDGTGGGGSGGGSSSGHPGSSYNRRCLATADIYYKFLCGPDFQWYSVPYDYRIKRDCTPGRAIYDPLPSGGSSFNYWDPTGYSAPTLGNGGGTTTTSGGGGDDPVDPRYDLPTPVVHNRTGCDPYDAALEQWLRYRRNVNLLNNIFDTGTRFVRDMLLDAIPGMPCVKFLANSGGIDLGPVADWAFFDGYFESYDNRRTNVEGQIDALLDAYGCAGGTAGRVIGTITPRVIRDNLSGLGSFVEEAMEFLTNVNDLKNEGEDIYDNIVVPYLDDTAEIEQLQLNAEESVVQNYFDMYVALELADIMLNNVETILGEENADLSFADSADVMTHVMESARGSDDGTADVSQTWDDMPVDAKTYEQIASRWNQSVRRYLEDGTVAEGGIDFSQLARDGVRIELGMRYVEKRGYADAADMMVAALNGIKARYEGASGDVCASVKFGLSQKVTMTREAFEGTLSLHNGHSSIAMKDIALSVEVTDEDGNVCNDLFGISDGTLQNISGKSVLSAGDGTLAASGDGSATVIFVPTPRAAPSEPKVYYFGARLSYTDPFTSETVKIDLTPVPLTVNPCPYLHFDYFVQRDVYADDPFTMDVVEASMPAELSVLVRNVGAAAAKNVTISSVRPQAVKNEKGLSIDFDLKNYSLDAMALNGSTAHLGLDDISLGTLAAGSSMVAQWWLTSSIEGHFVGMSATVTQLNSWGNPDTSLIDPQIGVHKLVRSLVSAEGTCFLTSEGADLYGLPDTIYTVSGGVYSVRSDAVVGSCGGVSGQSPELQLSVVARGEGWNYLCVAADGISRYNVTSVRRGDGSEVPLRNVWITDRVFRDGSSPILEDRLHIADEIASSGGVDYVIALEAKPSDCPEVTAFDLADGVVENTLRDAVVVTFSKEIDTASFTPDDIRIVFQGASLDDLSDLVLTRLDGTECRFRISGLASHCGVYGRYELTVQCAGIADRNGLLGLSGKSVSWVYTDTESPYVIATEGVPSRRVNRLDEIVVVVSTAVTPASFESARKTLNGRDVTSLLRLRSVDDGGTRFVLSGMEAVQDGDGDYELTVDGAGLRTSDGVSGVGSCVVRWTRDATAPRLERIEKDDSLGHVRMLLHFSEEIDLSTLTADRLSLSPCGVPSSVKIEALGDGVYVVSGFGDGVSADGTYVFTVDAAGVADAAGNVASGAKSVTWTIDTTPPAEPSGLSVSSEYGSVDTTVYTDRRELTVSGVVGERGATVQVLYRFIGGTETLLATPTVAANGAFSSTVALPESGGNVTLVIRQTDAAGNSSDREIRVYYDKIALTAELSGAPTVDAIADAITLAFSDAVIADDVTLDKFVLVHDGEGVALDGVTLTVSPDGKCFTLGGLSAFCAWDGVYSLAFDSTNVRKQTSGMKASGCAPLQWRYECPDREPPTVVSVKINGDVIGETVSNVITSVAIAFSEAVNVGELIERGLVSQVFKILMLGEDDSIIDIVRASSAKITYRDNEVVWTLNGNQIAAGRHRLVIDASLIADLSGNVMAAKPDDRIGGIQDFDFTGSEVVKVDSYAMPAWHDVDGDGLGDLVVGEKTAAGEGKVRVYLNVGSKTAPAFGAYSYLRLDDADLTVPSEGCQGAQVAFLDTTDDGISELLVGQADGSVAIAAGIGDGAYAYMTALTFASGMEYDSPRAYVTVAEDDDGYFRMMLGGMDGRFRWITTDGSGKLVKRWVNDACGAPIAVAAGRSSPAMVDVNGDGALDVLSGDTSGNVWAFLGEDDFFSAEPVCLFENVGGLPDRSRICVADVNGDGVSDLIVGRSDGSVSFALGSLRRCPGVDFQLDVSHIVVVDTFDGTVVTNVVSHGAEFHCEAPEPRYDVKTGIRHEQYVCDGATITVLASAESEHVAFTNFNMTVDKDLLVSWNSWSTNYWVTIGMILGSSDGEYGSSICAKYMAKGNYVRIDTSGLPSMRLRIVKIAGTTEGCYFDGDIFVVPVDRFRSITIVVDYSEYSVTFDVGEHGTRVGGGKLEQTVEYDSLAEAPEISPADGWRFVGWSPDVTTPITEESTFVAQYERIYHDVVISREDGSATTNSIAWGENVLCSAPSDIVDQSCKTQYVCLGTSFTAPVVTNRFTMMVTNDISFAWDIWQTNYWFELPATQNGTVFGADTGWHERNANFLLTATPAEHHHFVAWTGDISGCDAVDNVLDVLMDRPRTVRAAFAIDTHTVLIDGGLPTTDSTAVSYEYAYGSMVTGMVQNVVCYAGPTQFVCTGWSAINAEPSAGIGTQAIFKVVGDTVVNWNWQTNVLSLAESVNASGVVISTGGAGEWNPEWSGDSFDGRHSAKISGVANNTNAWMQTTVDGPGTVTFQWRCSLASRNTKVQFFVDDVAQGVINGSMEWADVNVTVYGEGSHVLKWRLFTGRSGASADDHAAVDDLAWKPSLPPTLGEALNTNLLWRTDGSVAWRGVSKSSRFDTRVAWAVASSLGDEQVAGLETKVYGSGLLTFEWAVSCEAEYDALEVSVDGETRTYITGETDWTTEGVDIFEDGWHTVRWEYVKDDMDDPDLVGRNLAMLDNVEWHSDAVPPTETATTPIPVPYAELDGAYKSYLDMAGGDYESAAGLTGKNGYKIWESYLIGLDPDKAESKFTAKIEIVDGKPVVTWEPALNGMDEDGACIKEGVRLYQLKGSTNLKDWVVVPDDGDAAYNFFKVEVTLPSVK